MLTSLIKNRCQEPDDNHCPSRPMILTVGLTRPFEQGLHDSFCVAEATNPEDAVRRLAQEKVAVLVLGSRLLPSDALSILTHQIANSPGTRTAVVLFCAGTEPESFQTFVNEGHIFYMARNEITAEQLRSVVASAAARFQSRPQEHHDPWEAPAAAVDLLADFCIRLPMQGDISSATALLIETARELISAELVQYLAYDPEDDTLAPADAVDDKECKGSAAAGLAAYVVRTSARIQLKCVGMDARYDAETDNPGGSEDAHFLAEPVIGCHGAPLGVITATRTGKSKPFSAEDAHCLELLAECAAPTLSQILLQNRIQAWMIKQTGLSGSNSDVFREEALEHHTRSWDQQGQVLKTLPPWLRRVYWVVLGVVFGGLLLLAAVAPVLRKILGRAG